MRNVISSANYVRPLGEVNNSPSLTVPDMSIPLSVLLDRFTRGQPLPATGQPMYDEDNDFPDPRTLDLVDIQEMRSNLNERSRSLSDEIREKRENLKIPTVNFMGRKASSADAGEAVE